jgi:hypothetical protein
MHFRLSSANISIHTIVAFDILFYSKSYLSLTNQPLHVQYGTFSFPYPIAGIGRRVSIS